MTDKPKEHEALNGLARELYAAMGYLASEDYDFSTSAHPQEFSCYVMAIYAMRYFQLNGLPRKPRNLAFRMMLGEPDPLIEALPSYKERWANKMKDADR